MRKIFHVAVSSGGMVAWNVNGKAVLIPNSDFHALVRELLIDQVNEDRDLSKFTLRITQHAKLGSEAENDRLQEVLDRRLRAKVDANRIDFTYRLEGEEARQSIDDFLESYKFNVGHIFYEVGRLHDRSDDIINISLRRKPSLLQKLRGLLGDAYAEINILRSEIALVEGNSFSFIVRFHTGKGYSFDDDGVQELAALQHGG